MRPARRERLLPPGEVLRSDAIPHAADSELYSPRPMSADRRSHPSYSRIPESAAIFVASLLMSARSVASPAAEPGIATKTASVSGVTLQYLEAGTGPAVILLHGYTQTSRMWRPLMPRLATSHRV